MLISVRMSVVLILPLDFRKSNLWSLHLDLTLFQQAGFYGTNPNINMSGASYPEFRVGSTSRVWDFLPRHASANENHGQVVCYSKAEHGLDR